MYKYWYFWNLLWLIDYVQDINVVFFSNKTNNKNWAY